MNTISTFIHSLLTVMQCTGCELNVKRFTVKLLLYT